MESSKTIHGKVTISIEEENILYIKMLKNSNIDIDTAEEIVKVASEISGDKKHGNLVDIRDMIFMSRQARMYLGKQERKNVVAIAVLKNSVFHNALANIYLKFSKPRIPTRAFERKIDALDFLRGKLREKQSKSTGNKKAKN